MAVHMDDYAIRVTGSAPPSLEHRAERIEVPDDTCSTNNKPYRNGESSSASSNSSCSTTSITTIPMYFAPTKQSVHTNTRPTSRASHSPQDHQEDQPGVMVPSSQANIEADSLTTALPDTNRHCHQQQSQRLVVRLDLRKIHTSRKGDAKVDKKKDPHHFRPTPSTRLLRRRHEPLPPQKQQQQSTSTLGPTTAAMEENDLLPSVDAPTLPNAVGDDMKEESSASPAAAEMSDSSSSTLTPASSSIPSSTSMTHSSPTIVQEAQGTTTYLIDDTTSQQCVLQDGISAHKEATEAAGVASPTTRAAKPVPSVVVELVARKRTRSSSEGPDKRIATGTKALAATTPKEEGAPRVKRRGRPVVSERASPQREQQQMQSSSLSSETIRSPSKPTAHVIQGRSPQKLSTLAKLSYKRDTPAPHLSKQDISVTGDDSAIKHNNDYCESCNGLGEFICCDACPKAFHFSCCQPPLDPDELPDEFYCVECKARLFPPKANKSGLFKQLLDNMDRMNPKSFALPQDIRTYFRGVVTNSDGEYSDAVDYKPTTTQKRQHTSHFSSEDDPLHLRDASGRFKACFQCNKTSLGGRQMIRCDHCPLYWHLDCLSPPLAHPPPSTRKWMCPNHADHVTPKRRKRRNPIPVTLSASLARNDGDIEVLSDDSDFDDRVLLDDGRVVSTTSIIYRVPEHNIKLGFVQKCHQLSQQRQQQQQHTQHQKESQQTRRMHATVVSVKKEMVEDDYLVAGAQDDEKEERRAEEGDDSTARFQRLVEVAMLEAQDPGTGKLLSALTSSPLSSLSALSTAVDTTKHALLVQDTVLKRLESKQEQEEYLQFRAFQRMVREQGADSMVRRLVAEHEAQKAELAMEGLLGMHNTDGSGSGSNK